MVYENLIKIQGIYLGKDGRYRVGLKLEGIRGIKVMSYPKYLMENHLNRYLNKDESVDHIDGNPLNNDISNLRVLSRKEHSYNDINRNKNVLVNCTYCNELFEIKGSTLHTRNRKDRKQSGYFCSRVCSGKYGKAIQLGIINPIKRERIHADKYKLHQY